MSYQTYITEAFVCGSADSNIADRSFLLFTKDAGILYANARSVREERSKQRYALQSFSHARVTLIRGKTGWKIAGAEPIQNFYSNTETREARAFLRNTFMLVRRVVHGETAHPDIFDDIKSACALLTVCNPSRLEVVLLFRILHTLGYIAPEVHHESLIGNILTIEMVESIQENDIAEHKLIVERALLESHL